MVGQDGMGIPAYRNQEEERHPTAPKGADYLNSADRKAAEIGERVLSRLQSKILIIVTQVVLIGSVNPLQVKRARLGIVFGMCKRCLRIGEPKRWRREGRAWHSLNLQNTERMLLGFATKKRRKNASFEPHQTD
jgi:hypothetical protein